MGTAGSGEVALLPRRDLSCLPLCLPPSSGWASGSSWLPRACLTSTLCTRDLGFRGPLCIEALQPGRGSAPPPVWTPETAHSPAGPSIWRPRLLSARALVCDANFKVQDYRKPNVDYFRPSETVQATFVEILPISRAVKERHSPNLNPNLGRPSSDPRRALGTRGLCSCRPLAQGSLQAPFLDSHSLQESLQIPPGP